MKKVSLTIAALAAFTLANAQAPVTVSASTTQQASLGLANVIDIAFVSGGGPASMPFNNPDDYQNGVTSGTSTLKVRSNKPFRIDVKTGTGFFNKEGVATTMSTSILGVEVTANNTGGSVVNGNGTYSPLSAANMQLISNGVNGGNQNFTVQYKATPGFTFPGGSYTADVIYTATQQ
jgi:hypothetical protein